MYLSIRKTSNIITFFAFIIIAAVLYGIAHIISAASSGRILLILIIFLCIILLFHLFLSILIKNLENIIIFRMISKKQIALAQVKPGTFYRSYRDILFKTHEIYSFPAEIYTQDGKTMQVTIYEDVKKTDFSYLPGYLYVTYSGNEKKIGIIPTFYIYLKPSLKEIVQKYEADCHPHYVEAIKHQGLSINSFK